MRSRHSAVEIGVFALAVLCLPSRGGGDPLAACVELCFVRVTGLLEAEAAQQQVDPGGAAADRWFPPPLSACHSLCIRNTSSALDIVAAVALVRQSAPRHVRPCVLVHIPRGASASIGVSLLRDSFGVVNAAGAYIPAELLEAAVASGGAAATGSARSGPLYGSAERLASRGWAVGGFRSASELRAGLGPALWAQLFSFAAVRSPFERVLSHAGALSLSGPQAAAPSDAERCGALRQWLGTALARHELILASAARYSKAVQAAAAAASPASSRVQAMVQARLRAEAATGCQGGFPAGSCPQLRYLLDTASGQPLVSLLLRAERLPSAYPELCAALGLARCQPPLDATAAARVLQALREAPQSLPRRLAAAPNARARRRGEARGGGAAASGRGAAGASSAASAPSAGLRAARLRLVRSLRRLDTGDSSASSGAAGEAEDLGRHYSAYMTDATARDVAELFGGDIALLNYTFAREAPSLC